MRRTYLLGNGLSLAFNADHYALGSLTSRVRDRLRGMTVDGGSLLEHLDGIGESLRPDFIAATRTTFEDIAGPVDRLSNTLSEFGPLDRVATDEERTVLRQLQSKMRALYTRVVGAVLEEVVQHPGTDAGSGRDRRTGRAGPVQPGTPPGRGRWFSARGLPSLRRGASVFRRPPSRVKTSSSVEAP